MSSVRSQQRRIALQAAGRVHDLAVPAQDALGSALIAMGLLPHDQERIIDPAGHAIELDTPAGDLREGGLYSIVAPAAHSTKADEHSHHGAPALLPWALLAFGLLTLTFGVVLENRGGGGGASWAVAIACCGLLTLLAWGRGAEQAGYVWVPLAVGGAAAFVLLWRLDPTATPQAVAAGMATIAVGGALLTLIGESTATRAIGAPIAIISAAIAAALFIGGLLDWNLLQTSVVIGAAACVGLRAVPYLVVKVDDGYHIDYGRFMLVRWTVRGRVPPYLPHVETETIRERMRTIEARLRVAMVYLSALTAVGMWAAAWHLDAASRLERISAAVVIALIGFGVLLVSRKTTARELKVPLRVAAAAGSAGAAALAGVRSSAIAGNTAVIVAAALLLGGIIAATIAPALARGARSIGWSRMGDIVEAIAIAFVVPAALVSVGTIDILRGVFSG